MPTPALRARIQVRRAVGSDLRPLRAAERRLFDHPLDDRAFREYLRDPRNLLLLAFRQGAPVGFLRGTALRQLHSLRPQLFLYEIAVDPRHRRTGVGRALVRALLAYARRRSFEEVFVLTQPGNRAAVRLYRATGGAPETPADRMFVYPLRSRRTRRRSR